jgi:hypothetical protein
VRPVVAEIEDVHELLAQGQAVQFHPSMVQRLVRFVPVGIRIGEASAVSQGELLKVSAVPARTRVVDRITKRLERMRGRRGEDPARTRPQIGAAPSDEFDTNGKPVPGHKTDDSQRSHDSPSPLPAAHIALAAGLDDPTKKRNESAPISHGPNRGSHVFRPVDLRPHDVPPTLRRPQGAGGTLAAYDRYLPEKDEVRSGPKGSETPPR